MTTSQRGILTHQGNLLDVPRGIIVHGCNALGLMGAGVARVVRQKYPRAYEVYRKQYETKGLNLGDIIPVVVREEPTAPILFIVNAITQQDVGTDRIQVDYESISTCFEKVAKIARDFKLEVHFPLIGCGLAGGSWEEVAPRIERALGDIPAHLWVL
jgi:O-acetyl-ADP-ribose deacetylase (regulator of RNase III)